MQIKKICSMVAAGVMLAGLVVSPVAAEVTKKIQIMGMQQAFVKTVDNFIVLYDSSSSMAQPYLGHKDLSEIQAEKKILAQANISLPNLDWNAGVYVFTPGAGVNPEGSFITVLPVAPYSKETFAKAVASLPETASGPTPLQNALTNVDSILGKLKGKTAVFLFTDGTYTESKEADAIKPLPMVKGLVKNHDVCLYVVSSATGQTEESLVKAVAEVNDCSMVIPFYEMLNNPAYTTSALYKIIATSADFGIFFDFDKSNLKKDVETGLVELGTFLEANPKTMVVLAGYTDDTGKEGYNMDLSKRRAESVREYLLANSKVPAERITMHWYGKNDPLVKNDTEEARALNRRVSITVIGL